MELCCGFFVPLLRVRVPVPVPVPAVIARLKVATGSVEAGFWDRMNASLEAKRQRSDEPPKPFEIKVVPGCLVKIDGFPTETSINAIKDVYAEAGKPARFVDLLSGSDAQTGSALIRFNTPEDAKAAIGIAAIDGHAVSVEVIHADPEDDLAR